MAAKPLVPTMIRTEFGDVLESEAFQAATGAQGDVTYVPGYSDMRRQRDQQLKEVADGKRKAADVRTRPVRLHLTRVTKYSGQPDDRKAIEFRNQGYRAVTKDDIGKHDWITNLPEAAVLGPAGEIRIGDTVLMMCDAKTATRNAAIVQMRTNQMLKETAAADFMKLGDRNQGSDPSVTVTPGEPIQVGSAIKAK